MSFLYPPAIYLKNFKLTQKLKEPYNQYILFTLDSATVNMLHQLLSLPLSYTHTIVCVHYMYNFTTESFENKSQTSWHFTPKYFMMYLVRKAFFYTTSEQLLHIRSLILINTMKWICCIWIFQIVIHNFFQNVLPNIFLSSRIYSIYTH